MGDGLIKVVYPIPNESPEVWKLFKPSVQRFVAGLHQFPPGIEYDLVPVLFDTDLTGEVTDLFVGLPVDQFLHYKGEGADIGAAQWVARGCDDDEFIVAMTSRIFFHRPGWLRQLWKARELYGVGLYGCFASKEGGKLHLCTRAYCMNAIVWNNYPFEITSRDQGTFFEVGLGNPEGNLMEWAQSRNVPSYVVYWDGVRPMEHALVPDSIFRKGDQSNCLVFDRHTEIYHRASDEERRRLESMCFLGVDPEPQKA